ncbi:hypothetical protein KJY73_14980 [Bowmanella sp. Y26]|uniref:General secretion pathway protein L n=1 Tax=Bowmanella yangjiangensis TaxID=2811230 RepID=A0ABS3CXR9_9ALTE|nr:hypothetical protein [Bowmanella yangjiangensis]MBN7820434.1 hypothetical protein [Bowmanella yangjiangensis]MBT1064895.1 hypothetical protein [Bowmanella yangjiangensis]
MIYVFRPRPKQLKQSELENWTSLQIKTLCPFVNGFHYSHISPAGLHIWFSNQAFSGIPETALQTALPDGDFVIKGQRFTYEQTWHNAVLVSCEIVDEKSHAQESVAIETNKPWATEVKLKKTLVSPLTWLVIGGFTLLCFILWFAISFLTLSMQEHSTKQESERLSELSGERIVQQTALREQQQQVQLINEWLNIHGQLPETLGLVAEKINKQGSWKVNQIRWQNKAMELELQGENIDIAQLITDLETIPELQSVSIRPFSSGGAWIIEAKQR